MVFCDNEELAESLKSIKLIPPTGKDKVKTDDKEEKVIQDFVYHLMILSPEDVKSIKKIIGSKNKEVEELNLGDEAKLAVEYNVTSFPYIVYCDWYGNELGREALNIKAFVPQVNVAMREMLKRQMALEQSLIKQFKLAKGSFDIEKKKGAFSALTISELKKIADYKGKKNSYESVINARGYLKEINKASEEVLNQICQKIGQAKNGDIIKELTEFKNKYKGLQVAETAEKKIKELSDGKNGG